MLKSDKIETNKDQEIDFRAIDWDQISDINTSSQEYFANVAKMAPSKVAAAFVFTVLDMVLVHLNKIT